jgi:hypothetical protein
LLNTPIEPTIFNLRKKININKMRAHCYKYYEAQAIVNLDCYLLIDENNPPIMVPDKFMFHIDLKEGAVREMQTTDVYRTSETVPNRKNSHSANDR